MRLELNDHNDLHAGVLHGTLAGGAAGLLNLLIPAPFGMAAGAFILGGAVVPPRSVTGWAKLAMLAMVAAGLVVALPTGSWWIAAVAGLVWASGRGKSAVGALTAGGLGVVGALAARLVVGAMATRSPFGLLAPGMAALVEGAAAGMLMGVASIGRQLVALPSSPVLPAAMPVGSGELGQLLRRAAIAHREAVAALGSGDETATVRLAADELLGKLAQLGAHWQRMESATSAIDRHELTVRSASLMKRAETAADPVARADFDRAREAVEAQATTLDEIARGRDRAVARLSREVALLERLRLTTLHRQSTDGARLASELAPLADELVQAGQELALAAETMADLGADDFGLAPVAAPPLLPASR